MNTELNTLSTPSLSASSVELTDATKKIPSPFTIVTPSPDNSSTMIQKDTLQSPDTNHLLKSKSKTRQLSQLDGWAEYLSSNDKLTDRDVKRQEAIERRRRNKEMLSVKEQSKKKELSEEEKLKKKEQSRLRRIQKEHDLEKAKLEKKKALLERAKKKITNSNSSDSSNIKIKGEIKETPKSDKFYHGKNQLVKCAQYFISSGGKSDISNHRERKKVERYIDGIADDKRRQKLNYKKTKKKSLKYTSTTSPTISPTPSENKSATPETEEDVGKIKQRKTNKKSKVKIEKSEPAKKQEIEKEAQWFINIEEDGEIDLDLNRKFFHDFVYENKLDDSIFKGMIPASKLFDDEFGHEYLPHQFFQGQEVQLHLPFSTIKESYKLSLPRNESFFNPFDELGKTMELMAHTFFPPEEKMKVINYENPNDCIIGRYTMAFKLYDQANIEINKKIKEKTVSKQSKKYKKRRTNFLVDNFDDNFDDFLNGNMSNLPIFDNDPDDRSVSFNTGNPPQNFSPRKTRRLRRNINADEVDSDDFNNIMDIVYSEAPRPPIDTANSILSILIPKGDLKRQKRTYTKRKLAKQQESFVDPKILELLSADGLSPKANNSFKKIQLLIDCLNEFNQLVDKLRNNGTTFKIKEKKSIPRTLIYEILNQSYSRTVLPDCRKLKSYKAFSSTTYGELMPSFLTKVYNQVGLSKDSKFIDLGSGVGNCTIQAAIEFGCESYGVEIMENASILADKQKVEFENRCKTWGIRPGKVKLFGKQSFTDNLNVKLIVDDCKFLLINNYLFDHELNMKVVDLLQDLKVGTKIISLKPIVPAGYNIGWGPTDSILNRMKTSKFVYSENSVSWTFNGGYYYITEVLQDIDENNFQQIRKRGLKIEEAEGVELNIFTNNV
ncbi:histone methyltransferase [Martiniozyma asiatica (nom. inval.)]|nr:histone methyltransferase [Martiniozyma asiatica]